MPVTVPQVPPDASWSRVASRLVAQSPGDRLWAVGLMSKKLRLSFSVQAV